MRQAPSIPTSLWKRSLASVWGLLVLSAAMAETPPRPEDFVRFEFEGHPAMGEALTAYAWRHFYHRLGNGLTLFNQEYLTVADMWLGGATPRGQTRTIQEIHRDHLLAMQLDTQGYVHTHQHFSHAHDLGWPFPIWTQSGQFPGRTAGWHFQHEQQLRGWTADALKQQGRDFFGDAAVAAWRCQDLVSEGIVEGRWRLRKAGSRPAILSPEGVTFEAFQSPFFQIRWHAAPALPNDAVGYLEWTSDEAPEFSRARRVYFYPDQTPLSQGNFHSLLPMHRQAGWRGRITGLRIVLPDSDTIESYDVDSLFTVYDTRHTINNPIFILASCWYFNWSGDLPFLRQNIVRMRRALAYQQTQLGVGELGHIRNTWPGHDGLAGFVRQPGGGKTLRPGHGIGNNYWDLIPFGWDDFYATYQYYAAARAMEQLEERVRMHPEWDVAGPEDGRPPEWLAQHLERVQATCNDKFWHAEAGRFFAAIDRDGRAHDYGFTFLNLDAIWYGVASDDHARSIMSWLNGDRLVAGDTSQGADIYHWRFGPRATTRRNLDWYGQAWTSPESIPWGGQVQDGGAVLGFSFYDLWARLRILGAENAWQRLQQIVDWEREVQAAGGYRAYYADGQQGTTLQGCGTPGGLGVDCEFYESSLLTAIIPLGFGGISPTPEGLDICPRLPDACRKMTIYNLWYQQARLDLTLTDDEVAGTAHALPRQGVTLRWPGQAVQRITQLGEFRFRIPE